MTWQTAYYGVTRNSFNTSGQVTTTEDTVYREVEECVSNLLVNSFTNSTRHSDWPVLAFSVDLGTISTMSDPVVSVLGLVRNPSIQVTSQSESRTPYFFSVSPSMSDMVRKFESHYALPLKTLESIG